MSDEMSVSTIPEVTIGETAAPPAPSNNGLTGEWGNFGTEMAQLAREQGLPATPAPAQEPTASLAPAPAQPAEATPQAPATQAQEPQVPEKFKGPDGKLDPARVLNSYLALEREHGRLRSGSGQPQAQPAAPLLAQPAQTQAPANALETNVALDLQAAGIDPRAAQAMAPVMARLMGSAYEAALKDAKREVGEVRQVIEGQAREQELRSLAQSDPFVMTPEGFEALNNIRQTRPWVNHSPTPWRTAYRELVADRAMSGSQNSGQGITPNPKPTAAPLPPAGGGPRVTPQAPQLQTKEQLESYLKTLNPAQETEFWKKQGLRFR